MKRMYLLIGLLMSGYLLSGQVNLQYNNKEFKVTQTSVVKDSSGTVFPFTEWMHMITSGEYTIKPLKPHEPETDFIVRKLSKAEQAERLASAPKPVESNAFRNKKKIAPFIGKDMNGLKIDSKDLKGKIVVLNFWFIRCPPCRMERPYLNELVKEYAADSSIEFIAVALDAKADLEIFLKNNPFDYRVVPDGRFVARDNEVTQYPTHVIIDREGKIAFHSVSYNAVTGYWIRKTIEEIRKKP